MAQFGVGGIALQAPQRPLFLSAEKKQQQQGGGGFLDWLLKGLDKESFTEKDPVLNRDDANGAASPAVPSKKKKGAAEPSKGGFLGGLFGKKD